MRCWRLKHRRLCQQLKCSELTARSGAFARSSESSSEVGERTRSGLAGQCPEPNIRLNSLCLALRHVGVKSPFPSKAS